MALTPAMLEGKLDLALRFWQQVKSLPGFGELQARLKTVAAQPVMLKALAKLIFDFSFSNRRPENGLELADALLERLHDIDFSHENVMWRYFELDGNARAAHGLEGLHAYLPQEGAANKDIGSFQGGFMRFSAKHNDIIPVLGDMVRWRLGLPARKHSVARSEPALEA